MKLTDQWLNRTDHFSAMQVATTSPRQLYDMYSKWIKNIFCQSMVF